MKPLIGYLITGVRLNLLIRLLRKSRMSFFPVHVIRLLFVFQNACWSSFFSKIEKQRYGKLISEHPLPSDPVFIIGHWRTGSTFLHKLLSLDDQFAAPTLFQTCFPESFISARPYYAPIMKHMIGKTRPFDQMKAGIDEPQEDEFALLRMSAESPLLKLAFTKSKVYFLLQEDCTFTTQSELWQRSMDHFCRKISWYTGKRPVLKNPFHSMRIEFLRNHFPKAKFIHIYRNPLNSVPSTLNMWSVVGKHNAMNHKWRSPGIEEVTDFYSIMMEEIRRQLTALKPGNYVEICYENLERDPVSELIKAYNTLGIDFTAGYEQRLIEFLKENGNYEKKIHTLNEENKQYICTKMKESMKRYGYLD